MSDERLRELERRWKETGAVEDEAAWLAERVRAGEFSGEQLRLLAHLGYAAGVHAWGESNPVSSGTSARQRVKTVKRWMHQFATWGQETAVRIACAMAPQAMPKWEKRSTERTPHRAIQAAEEWIACQCDMHREAARVAARAAEIASEALRWGDYDLSDWDTPERCENWAAARAGEAARHAASAAAMVPDEKTPADSVERYLATKAARQAYRAFEAVLIPQEMLPEVIRAELVPWILGTGDPVRERVEARQREAAGE